VSTLVDYNTAAGIDAKHPDLAAKPNVLTGSAPAGNKWNSDRIGTGTSAASIIGAVRNK
jgi:hypothetical protein